MQRMRLASFRRGFALEMMEQASSKLGNLFCLSALTSNSPIPRFPSEKIPNDVRYKHPAT